MIDNLVNQNLTAREYAHRYVQYYLESRQREAQEVAREERPIRLIRIARSGNAATQEPELSARGKLLFRAFHRQIA